MAIPTQFAPFSLGGACAEGTAGSGTGATAVALPTGGSQYLITNLGTVTMYVKFGAATGVDATDTTTGGGRVPIVSGNAQSYSRESNHTHCYFYAASNCAYSIASGEGP